MLACPEELEPDDRAVLAKHVSGCPECKQRMTAYSQQITLMKNIGRERPPSLVRETVLTQADAPVPSRRRIFGRRLAFKGVVVALLIAAIVVNTPLPHAVGRAVGIESQPGPPPGFQCLPSGAAIPRWYRILPSPQTFALGAHGYFLQGALQMVQHDLAQPSWYVYTGGGDQIASCGTAQGPIETVQVAINPDTGTELHAIGVAKSSNASGSP
jgi:hypothetical protein